jgi:hypothetical protein
MAVEREYAAAQIRYSDECFDPADVKRGPE